jgi:hypothetical protein
MPHHLKKQPVEPVKTQYKIVNILVVVADLISGNNYPFKLSGYLFTS